MLQLECYLPRLRHDFEVATAGLVLRGVVEHIFDLFVLEAVLHALFLVKPEHDFLALIVVLVLVLKDAGVSVDLVANVTQFELHDVARERARLVREDVTHLTELLIQT